jgi:hypothetical protein
MDYFAWTTQYRIKQRSFASNLRDVVAQIFGFDAEFVYTDDFKEMTTHVKDPADGTPMTGRRLLQYFGTDIGRAMDENCWARGPLTWFTLENADIGVIADCRFPNEVDAIRKSTALNTFIIKVERDGCDGDSHASERSLDDFDEDDFVIMNNGTLEDLQNEARRVARIIVERVSGATYEPIGKQN